MLGRKILVCLLFLVSCAQIVPAQWLKRTSTSLAWFHSVYFVNQNKGWIVGSQGAYLTTNDGGITWKAEKKCSENVIRDVYFADENHGWLLCERDVFSSGGLAPSYILETFDSGVTWTPVALDGEGRERLVRLFFTKEGIGWTVGESGTVYAMQNDKKTWKKSALPVRYLMLGGSFQDERHGLIVGGNGTSLFTEDGGTTWKPSIFTNKSLDKLHSVFFINNQNGWSVGVGGKIYITLNGGKLWREQNSTITEDLFDICFINTAEGWAVGDNGTILRTITGGNVWSQEQTNARHKLERIFFIGRKGWAVGFGGTILMHDSTVREKNKAVPPPILQKRNN